MVGSVARKGWGERKRKISIDNKSFICYNIYVQMKKNSLTNNNRRNTMVCKQCGKCSCKNKMSNKDNISIVVNESNANKSKYVVRYYSNITKKVSGVF